MVIEWSLGATRQFIGSAGGPLSSTMQNARRERGAARIGPWGPVVDDAKCAAEMGRGARRARGRSVGRSASRPVCRRRRRSVGASVGRSVVVVVRRRRDPLVGRSVGRRSVRRRRSSPWIGRSLLRRSGIEVPSFNGQKGAVDMMGAAMMRGPPRCTESRVSSPASCS